MDEDDGTTEHVECHDCDHEFTISSPDAVVVFRFCPLCGQRALHSVEVD